MSIQAAAVLSREHTAANVTVAFSTQWELKICFIQSTHTSFHFDIKYTKHILVFSNTHVTYDS
jgi:hypothetical protein